MRVLFSANYFPPSYTGGAEVANYHTCRGLLQRGVDCSFLVVNNRMPYALDDWYDLDGIPVHRRHFFTPRRNAWNDVFDWRVYRAVLDDLRRLRPNVVHLQNVSGATLAPYLACRAVGVPVVNTLHDLWLLCPNNMMLRQDFTQCDPNQNHAQCYHRYDFWANVPRRRAVFVALTSNVRAFISPSQALIDRHVEAGYRPERFRLVPYGLPHTSVPVPMHPGLRRIVAETAQRPTVTYAGGGVETKGARILLKALPEILGQNERLRIVIAGGGETELLNEFRRCGPRVEVLGWVPFGEMQALYAASDLTLVPSIWHENSPVVIYQSLQVGTPVAASTIGGSPELIELDQTGYLYAPHDPNELANSVRQHFSRPAHERRIMRQRCAEVALTRWSIEQHIDQHLTLYQELMGC